MNEGSWLANKNNIALSTETGYFSGWWPYSTPETFYENGNLFWACYCWSAISTPRYNSVQGEAHAYIPGTYGYPWLNNCEPGELFTMQYESGSTWYFWTTLTITEADTPYFGTKVANYQYQNGGC